MSLQLPQFGDHQCHLNIKYYLADTSLIKSLLSSKRTELVVHAKFASQLNKKSIKQYSEETYDLQAENF